ncbi:MAG TPA: LanC-like protein [Gaiellaceae bacterium]|nr:LanC-like protein [Gaiellaceae bacterium]
MTPTALFDPAAHEPPIDEPWDPARVQGAIRAIVEDAENTFDDGWPTHPTDSDGPHDDVRRFRTIYMGGAGVIQALTALQRRGLAELRGDYVPYLEQPYDPDFPDGDHERSLWMGETGIRLVLQRLAPSSENADRLESLICGNIRDERCEVMWGSPGTMLAAGALHGLSGEDRWLELWRESAEWLRGQWDPATEVWTQRLYGHVEQYIGPAHGFAGCVLALSLHPDDALHRRAAAGMRRYVVEEDGLANWKPTASMEGLQNSRGETRVQWCHGAPGMVASLAGIAPADDEHERLLLAGGELTWRAGPLVKGANLCHGTAGNGYAFLSLFQRTGDELWLDRARAFAMHAAAQVARAREEFGQGRYTLWTGDPGTAVYLADCLDGSLNVPLP